MVAAVSAIPAMSSAGLTKRFGGVTVVDGVDLMVPRGSVYGFLGPNGSGKTTTIRMLMGLVTATSGSFEILGQSAPAALHRVGALIESPAFLPFLSAQANLARLDAADRSADASSARERIGTALDRVGLTAAAGKRYGAYSLGMRQRLGIAAALLRPRELLVLDEPTNGLDPQGTREVRSLVAQLAGDGVTVFLSSHLLTEVEQLCSDVGVLSCGRLVWQGRLDDFRRGVDTAVDGRSDAAAGVRVRIETGVPGRAARVLAERAVTGVTVRGEVLTASLGAAAPEALLAALVRADVPVRGFTVVAPSLEDRFVALTGDGFDVSG